MSAQYRHSRSYDELTPYEVEGRVEGAKYWISDGRAEWPNARPKSEEWSVKADWDLTVLHQKEVVQRIVSFNDVRVFPAADFDGMRVGYQTCERQGIINLSPVNVVDTARKDASIRCERHPERLVLLDNGLLAANGDGAPTFWSPGGESHPTSLSGEDEYAFGVGELAKWNGSLFHLPDLERVPLTGWFRGMSRKHVFLIDENPVDYMIVRLSPHFETAWHREPKLKWSEKAYAQVLFSRDESTAHVQLADRPEWIRVNLQTGEEANTSWPRCIVQISRDESTAIAQNNARKETLLLHVGQEPRVLKGTDTGDGPPIFLFDDKLVLQSSHDGMRLFRSDDGSLFGTLIVGSDGTVIFLPGSSERQGATWFEILRPGTEPHCYSGTRFVPWELCEEARHFPGLLQEMLDELATAKPSEPRASVPPHGKPKDDGRDVCGY